MRALVSFALSLAVSLSTSSCNRGGQSKSPSSEEEPKSVPDVSAAPSQNQGEVKGSGIAPIHNAQIMQGLNETQPLCGRVLGKVQADTSPGRKVRFATFNMYGAFSTSVQSLKARIEPIALSIQKAQADVIGLQEAEDMDPAGRSAELLSVKLAELTVETWYWCFFRSNPFVPFDTDLNIGGTGPLSLAFSPQDGNTKRLGQKTWFMGDAIVSRLPFGSVGARRISPRLLTELPLCQTEQCRTWASGESRVVLRAEILLQGRSFHFFNSHFYTNITSESPKSQVRQATQINEYIEAVRARKNAPVAITCDCNSQPNGAVYAEFKKWNFKDAWSMLHPDKPGYTGGQNTASQQHTATTRIDYIFLKDVSPNEVRIFPEGASPASADKTILWPSDHLGVVVGSF